ncbi:MAG: TetR/AcrR family transcriptional regulator [Proteobacteria bacterium]|nr:MAG: TetR/AcrR family transcriptional regulator [Pseudomonadota bacterium]
MPVLLENSKSRDRLRSELLLIEAARKAFSLRGFDGASTRDIAKLAGLNLALINRYFGNKRGLFLAVLKSEAVVSTSRLLPYGRQRNLDEELLAFAEFTFKSTVRHVELLKITLIQAFAHDGLEDILPHLKLDRTEREIYQRIEFHIKKDRLRIKPSVVRAAVSGIGRIVLGTVTFHYLCFGKSEDKCIAELRESISCLLKLAIEN